MSTLQQSGPPAEPMAPASHRLRSRGAGSEGLLSPPQSAKPQSANARDAARTAVLDSLHGAGAVVLGPPGIGKTTFAREVIDLRDHHVFPVHLRGSPLSARTPYGALAWLLSDVAPEHLANPVQVGRALESLLVQQAGGRRIIMVIDNAEEIDALAALVTAQMCRNGAVSLLLVCADLIRCHQEFVRLWTDGVLKRVDLVPLDPRNMGELLAAAAGAPLTTLAQQKLWQQSRGNPLLASLLCRDHIAAKALLLQRGYWTWAGPLIHAGELPERVETVLRRFSPGERRAVEILALCRELPLALVLQLVPSDTVDALEEASLVTISGGHGQPVRLSWSLQPATIAARIPFGRSRDLWTEVMHVVELQGLGGAASAGMASWSLSAGIALDPATALEAARFSTMTGDTGEALRYARAAAPPRPLSVVLEEVAALRAEGNHAQAHRVLVAADGGSGVSEELRCGLLVARALAAARIRGCADDPLLLLQQAEQLLPEDAGVCPGPSLRVMLARAELLSLEGRISQLPASLSDDFEDPAAPADLRLWAGIRLAQQHVGAGRFAAAMELVAQIRSRLAVGITTDARTRELFFHHLFFLLIRCGELGEALILTQSVAEPDNRTGLGLSSGTELPTGLVHAYAGRGNAALEFLIPAIAQLEASDPDGTLPLATAAAAYAGRLERETRETVDVQPPSDPKYLTDPPVEATARYFRILSGGSGCAGEPSAPAETLRAHAGRALAGNNVPDAVLSYAAAALLGHRPAAADLAAAVARTDGTMASALGNLADGLLGEDVSALITAAEAALKQQNTRLAHGASSAALLLAVNSGSRTLLRRARQLQYESFRALSPANSIQRGLAQLSDFERELALRAAAGETSSALGGRFHLSARTVDWHLGRVFARLHVSGRSDLRASVSPWEIRPE